MATRCGGMVIAVKTPNFAGLANEVGEGFLIMRMFLVRHVPQVEIALHE